MTIVRTRLKVGAAVLAIGLIPMFALWSSVSTMLPADFVGDAITKILRRLTNTIRRRIDLSSPQAFRSVEWFDITGKPKVWYSRNRGGAYEIFDNEGSNTGTGRDHLPITLDVIDKIERQVQEEWDLREPPPPDVTIPERAPVVENKQPATATKLPQTSGREATEPPGPSPVSPAAISRTQPVVDAIAFCVTGNPYMAEGTLRTVAANVLGQRTTVVPIEDCSGSISLEARRYLYGIVRIEFDLSSFENPSHPGFFAAVVRCTVELHREGAIIDAQSLTGRAPSGSRRGAEDKALADLSTELASVLGSLGVQ